MNLRFILLQLILCLLIASSCKKPPLPQKPEEPQQKLIIALSKQYMAADKVDSAFAIWEVNGQQQTIKLSSKNDTLLADIKLFREGTGKLTVQLFSNIKFDRQYSSKWMFQQELNMQHSKAIELAGPAGFDDRKWLPRVLLKDAVGHAAIIALRPDDAYFMVQNVPAGLKKIVVARDYWQNTGGIFHAGGGEWQCIQNCTNANGDVENTQFFSFLPNQIGTRSWNHIEIVVLYVEDEWGGGYVLNLNHNL